MIRGLEYSKDKGNIVLDFFVPKRYDTNKIRNYSKKLSFGYRAFETPKFISYQSRNSNLPVVTTGNAIKHLQLKNSVK